MKRARLGATKRVHAEREENALAHAESQTMSARKSLDAVERGDVYSCDEALRLLFDASYVSGHAAANARSRTEPSARYNRLREALGDTIRRFHTVCIIPSQRRQGRR